MKLSILGFSGLVLCGCAHLATVKTTEPHVPTIAASDEKLAVATQELTIAEREQPLIALGNDLSAAKLSLSVLEKRPSDAIVSMCGIRNTMEKSASAPPIMQPTNRRVPL